MGLRSHLLSVNHRTPDSKADTSLGSGRSRRAALGVPLVVLGLLLTLGLPQGKLPWPTKASTQQVPSCGATTTSIVCVQPPSQQVTTADPSFSVDIVADKVNDLGAYQFTLAFDPTMVSFLDAVDGPFLGSTGRGVTCFPPSLSGGSVKFKCVTLRSEPDGPIGSGVLSTLTFEPLAPGTSALDLTEVILTDIGGTPLPLTTQDGEVTVVIGPTPTPCPGGVCPTATPTSTATATPTPAGGAPKVLVDPPAQSQLVGATFTFNVAVGNIADLAAYEFTLSWDPAVLDFVDVANGSFLASTGRSVFCPSPVVGVNTVRFGCVTLGTPPGASGSGVLSVLTLSGRGAGTTALHLFNVGLSDPLGSPVSAVVEDGVVAVTTAPTPTPTPCDGECPTATNTPTATVTPTPIPTAIPSPCAAGSGVDVCVQPEDQNVGEGSDFSVDVSVDDVGNLGAFEFTLAFDPDIVAFVSIEQGSFLGSTGRTVTCLGPTLTVDTVHYTCVTLGPTPGGPSGTGVLASITFLTLAVGTRPLTLEEVKLTDIFGTRIPATTHDGSVTVYTGPSPTPGPTKTATATPTETPTPGPTALTYVSPPSQVVPVGSNFGVDISIQDVSNLGSYEWLLLYNEDLLDFAGVVNGPFLGTTGRPVFCPAPILDVGSVRFGCSTTGATPAGPDGAGVLSTVTFSAQAQGTSPLDLVWAQLSDPLANDIPTTVEDGQAILVVPSPTSTGFGSGFRDGAAPGHQAPDLQARLTFSPLRPVGWMFVVLGAFLLSSGMAAPLLRSVGLASPCRHRACGGADIADQTEGDA